MPARTPGGLSLGAHRALIAATVIAERLHWLCSIRRRACCSTCGSGPVLVRLCGGTAVSCVLSVAPPGAASGPARGCGVPRQAALEQLADRAAVERSGAAQRPGERPASLRGVQALRVGVQRRTPSGQLAAGSGTRRPVHRATTRNSSALGARLRHPTQVRTGSRQHDAPRPRVYRDTPGGRVPGPARRPGRPGPPAEPRCAPGGRRTPARASGSSGARRCGCRSASRSAGPPAGRSGPPCRSPATAGSPARRRGPSARLASTISHAVDPGRRQRAGDERAGSSDQSTMSIFSPCSSAHDVADPRAHRPDAGALGVEAGDLAPDGDLRPVPGLAGDRDDLDAAVGDLGHLQGEQLAHQVGVGARHGHLRAAGPLATPRPRST